MASNQTWHLNGRTECQAKSDVQIDAQPKKWETNKLVVCEFMGASARGSLLEKNLKKKLKNQWLEVWRGSYQAMSSKIVYRFTKAHSMQCPPNLYSPRIRTWVRKTETNLGASSALSDDQNLVAERWCRDEQFIPLLWDRAWSIWWIRGSRSCRLRRDPVRWTSHRLLLWRIVLPWS